MKNYEKILLAYKIFFSLMSMIVIYGFYIFKLVDQTELSQKFSGNFEMMSMEYFTTFTLLSNVFCQVWFLIAAIQWKKEGLTKATNYTTATSLATLITVTLVVYNAVLIPVAGFPKEAFAAFSSIYSHVIMPIAFVVYVLFLIPRKEEVGLKQFFLKKFWIQFLVIFLYCVFALVRGELRYQSMQNTDPNNNIYTFSDENGNIKNYIYPYFFLDLHSKGLAGIPAYGIFVITFSGVLGFMIGISFLYNYSSNLIIKKSYYQNWNTQSS
ncbi:Pr6Pr family membrane protein [Spiroplasma tabanidicola]|uniref:Uncharacterized protein n=1 Tax=Spiroplasma tabanidicola TaxID=324079 RepID=A0A6I6CDI1_9MOLU|nr:Pr6Pr family membrane protein [Spiroplasma tabanidicola]QGS52034.1 hypothetical protein STABA_v1c06730 [Spiroplasma tabanidicola]